MHGSGRAYETYSRRLPPRSERVPMKPYSLGRDEGDAIWMFDALDTIKAGAGETGGALSVVEYLDFEGSSVPLHVNERWDSGFYIIDGDYTFVVADESLATSSGAWVFVPRNTAHAWRCESARGRVLRIATPAGIEAFYRDVGEPVVDRTRQPSRSEPDVEGLSSAAAQHGIAIVGPPPGRPGP
jgi:quercetin dioxygenase-like cupin family protein